MKRLDQTYEKARKRTLGRSIATAVVSLVLAAVVLVNLFTHVFPVISYYGNGMEPTLSNGQYLVLMKTRKVEEGDVIAFYYNNKILVRRVICTGGKQISIEQDGTVQIDGQPLAEPYLSARSMGQCNLDFPYFVSPDHVFVMGDDREIAMDSRLEEIGTIPSDRIIGKVLLTI